MKEAVKIDERALVCVSSSPWAYKPGDRPDMQISAICF